jgi:hypothetical protein
LPIPKIVVTVALMAAQTALQMTQKIKGPRLDSLKTTTAEYGTPIPRFWGKRKFECPVIMAADLIETRHTSKGKAGKNTQYKYFADFAILICDHEIDAVTRIWMDEKLVYQTTDAGPTSVGAAANLTVGGNMRIYLGTETQDPDPMIEAWCDDRYGPNSCPAYRGSAYIAFERLPVNNFGNRIPNITVEAVSSKTPAYPWEFTASTSTFINKRCSPDGLRLYAISAYIQVFDVPNRTQIIYQTFSSGLGTSTPYAFSTDGIYGMDVVGQHLFFVSFDGGITDLGSTGGGGWTNGVWAAGGQLLLAPGSFAGMNQAVAAVPATPIPVNYFASSYFTTTDGDAIGLGTTSASGATHDLVIGPALANGTIIDTTAYGTSGVAYGFDNGTNFVVRQGNYLFLTTRTAPYSIVSAVNTSGAGASDPVCTYTAIDPGADWWWDGLQRRSSADLSVLQTATLTDWVGSSRPAEVVGTIYDRVNDALLSFDTALDPGIIWRYLNRVGSSAVTLKTVVDGVSGWAFPTGSTLPDTSALTQPVLGYSVTQGAGKEMIGPLLDIHDVDCRPHDFGIQFVNRGGAPSGMILTQDFVRSGDESRYTVTIQQDTDLPRKLTFNYADNDHEQQANNAIAQRPFDAVNTTREETIDLSTYADTADGAQQKADRFLRRMWNSRERIKNSLTAQKLALEPGDVTTVSLDGVLRNVRLDKWTKAQSVLQCEFVRDEVSVAAINSATTGADMQGNDVQTITVPTETRGFIIDAPLVQDADNDVNPVLYYAAGTYGAGTWLGATVNEQDTAGDYSILFGSVDSTNGATWGFATSALGTANPNLWDRGNSVTVTVYGTLTSSTEAAINADPALNLIALGTDDRWEYIQFVNATLTGTSGNANLYTLSGFKRGRRGTEGNVGNHANGDSLIVLSSAVPVEIGTDAVGDSLSFKIQSLGRDVDAAPAIDLTYDGNTLKPYAPARVKWSYDGTDLTGTIYRRTRVGGSWSSSGGTIPLGETVEAYEVDIYNGSTFKRTISVSGTNVFTYTAAMAAADGITLPTPPTINAYQMSTTVGRGFALAA